jgi:hypothetical protein
MAIPPPLLAYPTTPIFPFPFMAGKTIVQKAMLQKTISLPKQPIINSKKQKRRHSTHE